MKHMTTIHEKVHTAIQTFEEQLSVIDITLEEEMQKHYKERKTLLLEFLYKEKIRYQFALSEFKKLLDA